MRKCAESALSGDDPSDAPAGRLLRCFDLASRKPLPALYGLRSDSSVDRLPGPHKALLVNSGECGSIGFGGSRGFTTRTEA
jgi:hypothetical protein